MAEQHAGEAKYYYPSLDERFLETAPGIEAGRGNTALQEALESRYQDPTTWTSISPDPTGFADPSASQ